MKMHNLISTLGTVVAHRQTSLWSQKIYQSLISNSCKNHIMIHLGTSFAITNVGMLAILLLIARNHTYTLSTGLQALKQGIIWGGIVGIILLSIESNLIQVSKDYQQQVLSIIMTLWFVLVFFAVRLKETAILLTTLVCGTLFNTMLLLGILYSRYHLGILVSIGIHGIIAFMTYRMLTSSKLTKC